MTLQLQAQHILDDWLLSCTRANKLSRNTIAVGVVAIEDFIALNLVEMANDSASQFFDVLIQIIEIYNMRLEEVETDMSLKIEVQ
jgi:Domain of unknown function (DUF4928)